ncbi:GNAT family N-acetyltransferase [Aurantibacter sp.]|uniref:GNAT family N-acetyltransferase n=1 Tax=Aurantibacter sp. TaxID=2807103 RepID=UPI003263A67D
MDDIIIRKANIKDLASLLEFEQGIIKAERPFDPTLADDPISYYDLKELIASDTAEILVGEHKGKLIASGYANIKQAKSYLDHKRFSYLGFMYTDPNYRGKGLNRRIVDGLKEWSFEKGVKEIRLTVYEENIGAIKAYEKVGFKNHLIEMRIED